MATLYERLPEYDALITRSGTAVTAELLDHAPRLRFVGRAGVGVDNIDVEACSRRGIVVANAPYGNVVSAAEHTLAMLLALVRRIPEAHAQLKRLEWNRGIHGSELARKTVGVVGLGKVGSRVAARLRAFEATVLAYDPYIPEARAREVGAQLTDFETLLARVGRHHRPRAADVRDRAHGDGGGAGPHQAGRAAGELRARRDHPRGRSPGRARVRARRRRRHRRVERGTAGRPARDHVDPASPRGRSPRTSGRTPWRPR